MSSYTRIITCYTRSAHVVYEKHMIQKRTLLNLFDSVFNKNLILITVTGIFIGISLNLKIFKRLVWKSVPLLTITGIKCIGNSEFFFKKMMKNLTERILKISNSVIPKRHLRQCQFNVTPFVLDVPQLVLYCEKKYIQRKDSKWFVLSLQLFAFKFKNLFPVIASTFERSTIKIFKY